MVSKKAVKKTTKTNSKNNSKKNKNSNLVKFKTANDPLIKEIGSISIISIGIILIISLYWTGSGGFFGSSINGLLNGLVGFGAYVFPFLLIYVGIYMFVKKTLITMYRFTIALLLFICVITYVYISGYNPPRTYVNFWEYISFNYTSGNISNGGLIGAILGNFLTIIFGEIGSYIFLFVSGLTLTILLTGKSVFNFVSNSVDSVADLLLEQGSLKENTENKIGKKINTKKGKRKAPVFTIGEINRNADNSEILLVNEEIDRKAKKITILKDYKTKNIIQTVDLDNKNYDNIEPPKSLVSGYEGETNKDFVEQPEYTKEQEYYYDTEETKLYDLKDFRERDFVPKEEIFIETPYASGEKEQPKSEFDIEPPSFMTKATEKDKNNYDIKQNNNDENSNNNTIKQKAKETPLEYTFPDIEFLYKNPLVSTSGSKAQILENSKKLEDTLKSFGVEAKVVEVSKGPTVTRYELSPGQGVKVSKISNLADDLALNLAAVGIRIEAPIPGKAAVGIEIPNKEILPVHLREVIGDDSFENFPSKLAIALGKDIAGNTVVADIAKMPHLLIAGATGSGKSVCINTLVTSLIYKSTPDEVKLLMIDPKVVELSIYNGIPHLLIPVVTDPKKAAGALNWAVQEMITRYNLFAETSVRDLNGYNLYVKEKGEASPLPQIVIIIDELSDLMMAAPGEVEDAICRLAQMARAAGIHLIIATQRPSVDVITGLIKANIPSRLAFAVSSGTDSRTILDMTGAEKLLGKGDMLFYPVGMTKPLRVQGAYISDKEVETIVNFLKKDYSTEYDQNMIDEITAPKIVGLDDGESDELFESAVEFVIEKDKVSASLLQRHFRIGYNRASRIIDDLEARGIISSDDGNKNKKVIMTYEEWQDLKNVTV